MPKSAGVGPTRRNNMKSGINSVETMNMAMISIECFDPYRLLTPDNTVPNRRRARLLGLFHDKNLIVSLSDAQRWFPTADQKDRHYGTLRSLKDGKSCLVSSSLDCCGRSIGLEILAFNRCIPHKNAVLSG